MSCGKLVFTSPFFAEKRGGGRTIALQQFRMIWPRCAERWFSGRLFSLYRQYLSLKKTFHSSHPFPQALYRNAIYFGVKLEIFRASIRNGFDLHRQRLDFPETPPFTDLRVKTDRDTRPKAGKSRNLKSKTVWHPVRFFDEKQ